jgi:hypothetical protein
LSDPEKDLPWAETISEWIGCVGIGFVPLLTNLILAIFEEERVREYALSLGAFIAEFFLFCLVTITATTVIYASKYNIVRILAHKPPALPTSLFLAPVPLGLVTFGILIGIRTGNITGLAILACTVSCFLGTLFFSLVYERVIGKAAFAASR